MHGLIKLRAGHDRRSNPRRVPIKIQITCPSQQTQSDDRPDKQKWCCSPHSPWVIVQHLGARVSEKRSGNFELMSISVNHQYTDSPHTFSWRIVGVWVAYHEVEVINVVRCLLRVVRSKGQCSLRQMPVVERRRSCSHS